MDQSIKKPLTKKYFSSIFSILNYRMSKIEARLAQVLFDKVSIGDVNMELNDQRCRSNIKSVGSMPQSVCMLQTFV